MFFFNPRHSFTVAAVARHAGDQRPPPTPRRRRRFVAGRPMRAALANAGRSAGGGGDGGKRRVMVVADSGRESAGALEWALSHAVLEQDELLLLHVAPHDAAAVRRSGSFAAFLRRSLPPDDEEQQKKQSEEFLEVMRSACAAKQPKVKVTIERVETETKEAAAAAILSHAGILGVDLLVIGHRRSSSAAFRQKFMSATGGKASVDTAEFLIENSKCLCVGVQKKGQNAGYILNTKSYKNFWLLA